MNDTIPAEQLRLATLDALHLLDIDASQDLNLITQLCIDLFGVSGAYVSLIDKERQWIKSHQGISLCDAPRQQSFCNHTIVQHEVLVVEDARTDPRFRDYPLVTGPAALRFYAGAPLLTEDGYAMGALCIVDTQPRQLDASGRARLQCLARLAMSHMMLKRTAGRMDVVTGLPNKFKLLEDLADIARLSSRQQQVLAYIDMPDASKAFDIASVLGTAFHDDLVRNVGRRLASLVKGRADLYHITNARFALLSHPGETATFVDFLKKMEQPLNEPVQIMSVPLKLPSYGGIVIINADPAAVIDAPRKAVATVHQAYQQRQRWVSYDAEADKHHQRRFQLLNDIPDALAQNDFRLVYQPKLDLGDGRIRSAEALLRWQHPRLGSISPMEFIPLIEQTTLIQPTSDWVIHTALRQMAAWRKSGLEIKLAINLSALNFEEDDICERLEWACGEANVPANMVEIECTEGLWMQSEKTLHTLHAIRALGMDLAIDDFGTGYSNFAYLQRVPATTVKIDQSLIRNLDRNPRDRRIVQSLIILANELEYRIVAEGVETEDTLQLMREWGCNEAQGYYLSKPLEPDAFAAFLLDHAVVS